MSSWLLSMPKGGDSTASQGNLFQSLTILTVQKYFLVFKWICRYLNLCPLTLLLSPGTTENSLAPSSLHPSFRSLYKLMRFPLSLLYSRLKNLRFLSLFSYERCSTPLIFIVALCQIHFNKSMSPLYWGGQNWRQYSRCGLISAG